MNSQWPKLFETYFLSSSTRLSQTTTTTSDDDLVFYVTRQLQNDFHHPLVSFIISNSRKSRSRLFFLASCRSFSSS